MAPQAIDEKPLLYSPAASRAVQECTVSRSYLGVGRLVGAAPRKPAVHRESGGSRLARWHVSKSEQRSKSPGFSLYLRYGWGLGGASTTSSCLYPRLTRSAS